MRKVVLVLLALLMVTSSVQAQTVTPAQKDALLETLHALRATYPTPMTEAQLGEMMNAAAWKHRADGWLLLRKDVNSCPVPSLGVSIWCDGMIHGPSIRHFDMIVDREGLARIDWQDVGPCVLGPTSGCEMSRAIPPTGAVVVPVPTPQPTPTEPEPPSPILELLSQILQELRNQNALIEKRLSELLTEIRRGVRIRW